VSPLGNSLKLFQGFCSDKACDLPEPLNPMDVIPVTGQSSSSALVMVKVQVLTCIVNKPVPHLKLTRISSCIYFSVCISECKLLCILTPFFGKRDKIMYYKTYYYAIQNVL
jgi:hypothetical protein